MGGGKHRRPTDHSTEDKLRIGSVDHRLSAIAIVRHVWHNELCAETKK